VIFCGNQGVVKTFVCNLLDKRRSKFARPGKPQPEFELASMELEDKHTVVALYTFSGSTEAKQQNSDLNHLSFTTIFSSVCHNALPPFLEKLGNAQLSMGSRDSVP